MGYRLTVYDKSTFQILNAVVTQPLNTFNTWKRTEFYTDNISIDLLLDILRSSWRGYSYQTFYYPRVHTLTFGFDFSTLSNSLESLVSCFHSSYPPGEIYRAVLPFYLVFLLRFVVPSSFMSLKLSKLLLVRQFLLSYSVPVAPTGSPPIP